MIDEEEEEEEEEEEDKSLCHWLAAKSYEWLCIGVRCETRQPWIQHTEAT